MKKANKFKTIRQVGNSAGILLDKETLIKGEFEIGDIVDCQVIKNKITLTRVQKNEPKRTN